MKIRIANKNNVIVFIDFMAVKTDTASPAYRDAREKMYKVRDALNKIMELSEPDAAPQIEQPALNDVSNTLIQMKKLLDAGILTQEEFDDKKRQLLGL